MIVKVISNKANRDITINKLYPVIIKKDDEIRIVDDFGGLSIYELKDFQVYKENISSYSKINNNIVYKLVDYPTFLENYYNDDKKAMDEVRHSLINIFEEDLDSEELVELITSEDYSNDEKMVFVEAIENKITDRSVKILAKYFQNKQDIETEFLLSICKLLSKYQNQEVYDLFLKYISDDTINNDSVQNIVVEYFNN
ncbi:hypothetical protein QJV03_09135 [Listeria swaminathanii]|uniref:Uncharacterized protein n=1 Tax=Listeria swaminathanii TaxID=2713501 RepID=A0ABU2IJ99_9LIST|nr:hypothetical protein [Listeria swaminathanii]MDT0017343.1 hypothetical protein [Listeria swaminathanii]MDT0023297.1 hypothetical protein [Listeria swaminathanii]MDT0034239.1 hypothetical protein [Listeria swaminathanii]MDT0053062.1 hypothetical protein [Listeria swaminathanii]MDT0055827.1 hypothetical protein [Listeria swaminathanii]